MSIPTVKVYITVHGDPSVDIPSLTDTIEIKWDLDEIKDDRNRIRDILQRAWSEMYDDRASVSFDDECPDCGRTIINCICLKYMP